MQIAGKIISLTRPYWPRVLCGVLISIMLSGINGAIAWLTKPALDVVFIEKKYEYLKLLPLGVLLLFAVKGFFGFLQTYLMKSAGVKLVRETRNKLYKHILYLPLGYFNKESSGVIISRIINDVSKIEGIISDVSRTLAVEVPTVIFLLGVAFYRRWDLTLIALCVLPLIGYNSKKFGKRVKNRSREVQRKVALLTQKIGETVLGTRIIKIFNREETIAKKFTDANQNYYREVLRVVRLKEFTKLIIDVATGTGLAVIVWYGGAMVKNGAITAGDFASILVAVFMIFSPVKKIGEAYNSFQETWAAMERTDTLLEAAHEETGSLKIGSFNETICFRNVSFMYHGNKYPVLEDINLEIKRGEVIAIVGRSGVGKSTLVDLIPRFNRTSGGALTIDGNNINDIEIHSLRELIGIVSQDVILFNDTVYDNIAFGRPEASKAEIIEAARLAYADEFIQELPEKYDAVIGERGLKLSGGQRQRIAIARAVLKNPPILVLDEATSSLDSVSEALVQEALEKLMKGRTTIVIAHRLSTIKNADRIVLIENGKIVDIGTHDKLIEMNTSYRELYMTFSGTG
jgi:ATP-binding cassette, subfamily B, bacterial MsbA